MTGNLQRRGSGNQFAGERGGLRQVLAQSTCSSYLSTHVANPSVPSEGIPSTTSCTLLAALVGETFRLPAARVASRLTGCFMGHFPASVSSMGDSDLRVPRVLSEFYDALYAAFGPQHWWPARTRDEMIIGAILTQNTAWTNVERAMARLKAARIESLAQIDRLDEAELAELIRPAGTFRVKARRLKAFAGWLGRCWGGELTRMFAAGLEVLRPELLAVPGIGPETADAILLYAGGLPTFVVDAYTRRVLRRHAILAATASYDETKALLERHLPADAGRFGEYHALLVELGKRFCRPRARCETCPLRAWPHDETR